MLLSIVWQTRGNIFLWQAIEQFYFFNILYPFFDNSKDYDKNLYALLSFHINTFVRKTSFILKWENMG